MSDYELEIDHIAVGLTKPPMKLGVPFMPFFSNILVCLMSWMFYQSLSGNAGLGSIVFFCGICVVTHLLMANISKKDAYGLLIFITNQIYFRQHATHKIWGNTDSFSP